MALEIKVVIIVYFNYVPNINTAACIRCFCDGCRFNIRSGLQRQNEGVA